jgi:hypothetical protein
MPKGAFKYGAGKSMSGKKTGMSGTGKMSCAHGTNGQSKDNNMNRTTGGDMLGVGCRTFKKAPYKLAGKGRD